MKVMEAAAKAEQELYESLEALTVNVISPENESETRAYLEERLLRYKSMMTKKNKLIGSIQEKVRKLLRGRRQSLMKLVKN